MRAVIRLRTNDSKLNQLTLEGFLQSEGLSVVDFVRDKEWLNLPDQKPLLDKVENFKKAIFSLDAREIYPLAYIYNDTTEGLVSYNSITTYYGIRLFKHNKKQLLESCEKLVESLINYFERNNTLLDIQNIGIKEVGQPQDTIVGEVYKEEQEKLNKAIKERKVEYKFGRWFLGLAILFTLISFFTNYYFNFKNDKLETPLGWLVHFFERITGPLLITGGVLFYNFWTHKQKIVSSKSVIIWK